MVRSVCPSADSSSCPPRMSSCGSAPWAPSVWLWTTNESSPDASVNRLPHVVVGAAVAGTGTATFLAGGVPPGRAFLHFAPRGGPPPGQVLHQIRGVGSAPAGRVVPAGLRRVRHVVADGDVEEIGAVARALALLVQAVVGESEPLLRSCRLDARPHADPERRGQTGPGAP